MHRWRAGLWEVGNEPAVFSGQRRHLDIALSAGGKFVQQTAWSAEGIVFFLVEEGNQNPVMTHNLPRWVSRGSFDSQCKGGRTYIGVFERVKLIRSVVGRKAAKPELKYFDKQIIVLDPPLCHVRQTDCA